MDKKKLEKLIAFSFIFIALSFLMLLFLLFLNIKIPVIIATVFVVLAFFISLIAGVSILVDSHDQ